MRPPHVLLTADAVGGVWQHALDLARGLAEEGIRTTLAVLGPLPSPGHAATARAIPGLDLLVTDLPLDWTAESARDLQAAAMRLADLAVGRGVDALQVHAPALAATPSLPIPLIAVCHSCVATWWRAVRGSALPGDFRWRMRLTARGIAQADAIVAPSRSFASAVAATYGLLHPPLVIRNGRTSPPARPRRSRGYAFTAGRLWDDGKNIATLDQAAAMAPVPVLAAGPVEGPNGARAAPANLTLLGSLGDGEVRERLADALLYVTSARYEPFGLSVLEAAQTSLPLVLSDIPTFRELWDGAALFVPAEDPEGFALAMARIAADDLLAARLAAAASLRARRYSRRRMASAYAALYRRLVRTRQPGRLAR